MLGRNTAKIKRDEIPHAETWPFLLTLLTKCITIEIAASKKRPPKLILAKTLRMAVQCAEDVKLSGKSLLVFSVARQLFEHLWGVIKDVPIFQSEYSSILRHLLTVKEYRHQMRKRTYCNLVVFFINKVETGVSVKATMQHGSKEEVFRNILMLHVLLENPPGDFPETIREDLVNGFTRIFSKIREEGKVSRKLMECVNTYLQLDGPNLGSQATIDIHTQLREFLFRSWFTTHDRGLKESFISYARVQLKLSRSFSEGVELVEQLLDVVGKELDESSSTSGGTLLNESSKDDRIGSLTFAQQSLMELAAAVFYEVCTQTPEIMHHEKRLKLEKTTSWIKNGLVKGSWLWNCAFYYLCHGYGRQLEKSLLICLFEGACQCLERILNNLNSTHSYEALLWLLRALQEISSLFIVSSEDDYISSFTVKESLLITNYWRTIWSSLLQKLHMVFSVSTLENDVFILLANIVLRDQVDLAVPRDIWDHHVFKYRLSSPALYFIACYFSKKGAHGDAHDILHLRKNLLTAVLGLLEHKESLDLNEQNVVLIPAALFSLSAGCAPLLAYPVYESAFSDSGQHWSKLSAQNEGQGVIDEVTVCSVKILAEIKAKPHAVVWTRNYPSIRLPRFIKETLICEMDNYIMGFLASTEDEKIVLSNLLFGSSLLCNYIYCFILAGLKEERVDLLPKALKYIMGLLNDALCMINEKHKAVISSGLSCLNLVFDASPSVLSSFRIFSSSPLFALFNNDKSYVESELLEQVIQLVEKLLLALSRLFVEISNIVRDMEFVLDVSMSSSSNLLQDYSTLKEGTVRIVDMELDADDNSKDANSFATGDISQARLFSSPIHCKMEILSVVSTLFSVSSLLTWETLLDLLKQEDDAEVCEGIIYQMCKNVPASSEKLASLVDSLKKMMDSTRTSKLCTVRIINAIHALLKSLRNESNDKGTDLEKKEKAEQLITIQVLSSIGDLINEAAEAGLPDWSARIKLVDCIFDLILLEPILAQVMIERLLAMLQDTDYRVRLLLARRIGTLFQIWDGHSELFHDICSSFDIEMVRFSKGKLVKAKDILVPSSVFELSMKTALVTLAHIALCSDEVEVEAVFMICVVAAMHPFQRKLTYGILNDLAKRLNYPSRYKYLEELVGVILGDWVACEVSLAALVEVHDLFVYETKPEDFIRFCCPWLLPPLLLSESFADLKWVSEVALQPLPLLVEEHFVPIFAVCIALHCSAKTEREKGRTALQSTILRVANISELERDELIKKHMVSIVSFLLSLASCSKDPSIPFFSKDDVAVAVRTVIDGFLEMDNHPMVMGIVDKINVFRPDRVFKFLVEIHYQIAAALHPRHRSHRLSAIEVLVNILGHRTTLASTSFFIFNIVGRYIESQPLQTQCCSILSTLLELFSTNASKEVIEVLGEQLQFIVSKLLVCCIASESEAKNQSICSTRILSLLHQLILDTPCLEDYIRGLEPFPELHCFERIRKFQEELCMTYSPRDHFLRFVKRSSHLPQEVITWRLRTLHKQLLMGKIIDLEEKDVNQAGEYNCWNCDQEVVCAVWALASICGSNEANDCSVLVADFISKLGIGDPYRIVFRLPVIASQKHECIPSFLQHSEAAFLSSESNISEVLLVNLLKLLKKYLVDESVEIVHITSRTLRGILSTERGRTALLSLNNYEQSLVGVHSQAVNIGEVERTCLGSERSLCDALRLDNSSVWGTDTKTYESWICLLVQSLIYHVDDIILRLSQEIVSVKVEIAELVFGHVLVNIAERTDSEDNLCQIITEKVQEHILVESNGMIKSIQVFLNVLNRLRTCHVTRKSNSFSAPSKHGKLSTSGRVRDRSSHISSQTYMWKKVYWLSIDYLVVANAAIRCGSYFTAVLYVEHWCEEQFNGLTMGCPDFSHLESLPPHVELLVAALPRINEPDSIYGILQSNKLTSQIIRFEHEGNWNKALQCYDLLVRSAAMEEVNEQHKPSSYGAQVLFEKEQRKDNWKSFTGLMRSLQNTGCTHVLDVYCNGLINQKDYFQGDSEFMELQYEAAWRAGNWDISFASETSNPYYKQNDKSSHFNENLHSCLRALQEGDYCEFTMKLKDSRKELMTSICFRSKESTQYINGTIVKLQMLDHLSMSWDLRWKLIPVQKLMSSDSREPVLPTKSQLDMLNKDWSLILRQAQLNLNLLEPSLAFRRVLLKILNCKECTMEHLLQSTSALRKGMRFSLAAAALHELKLLSSEMECQPSCHAHCLGRLEEAKLLWAQGQHDLGISLAKYILQNYPTEQETPNIYRLIGKWLAETRSSNSRTILEEYLKHAVELVESNKTSDKNVISKRSQTYFHLAHYADSLFRSYEERLASSEWQAAMRLRKHKTRELDALIKRIKSSKGQKTDCSMKIQELQKQLTMDREEAEKLQDDRDNFLNVALEAYQHCLVIGGKYDIRVVFRLTSLWFNLSSRDIVTKSMLSTVKEVQSFKFVPLVYQIASRLGSQKDIQGSASFQVALLSLVKKMAIEHPYHTLFQLLALANGDRVKDKLRSKNSFVVDVDKKLAAVNLLNELSSCHGVIIMQMKQMVELYIRLAELETRKEETNKKIILPRDIRSIRQLEFVPVVTASIPVDPTCQYKEGSFPYFMGITDSIIVMNGINAPKVAECLGSDGKKYRQLAKSGNDDLRQDAVMEQFFGLVNIFLQNNRDTWKRRLKIRTYKVVPFTPSAGVIEWVDRTIPLGEYLLGSTRTGGAHGRYGNGDWSFLQCREHMANEKDKRKAFLKVCDNFRPVMHNFFLEKFLQPAEWFERRLTYTRSVAASAMVGYIVGLGDRHSMNILIDQATAEVVHIDLGVAFEQGLMLKTPERVPFRLTRDIIDGMGVTGVEGIFRRCCEETLSVMRANKEALLTIVEVFIHDPLYKWALSPLKALQRQKETEDYSESSLESSQDECEGNKDAARAILRVKQKLDGYEEGDLRSVQGQVQQLIQDAIDVDRLCQMFPGWGAWL